MDTIYLMICWCALALIDLFIVGFGIWLSTLLIKRAADKSTKIGGTIISILVSLGGIVLLGVCVHTMFSIL